MLPVEIVLWAKETGENQKMVILGRKNRQIPPNTLRRRFITVSFHSYGDHRKKEQANSAEYFKAQVHNSILSFLTSGQKSGVARRAIMIRVGAAKTPSSS